MLAVPELVRRTEKHEPALQHEPDAGAEQQPLAHVVRHEDHPLAEPPLERRELALQLHPGDRIERTERLVQEQERRARRGGAPPPPPPSGAPPPPPRAAPPPTGRRPRTPGHR